MAGTSPAMTAQPMRYVAAKTLSRQFDHFGQMAGRIGALTDVDPEPARLQDAILVEADEIEIVDREAPRRLPVLPGLEDDLLHALEREQRRGDARDELVREQEQRRFAVNVAAVRDRDGDLDGLGRLRRARVAGQIGEREAAVGQAVAKGKLRRRGHVEI